MGNFEKLSVLVIVVIIVMILVVALHTWSDKPGEDEASGKPALEGLVNVTDDEGEWEQPNRGEQPLRQDGPLPEQDARLGDGGGMGDILDIKVVPDDQLQDGPAPDAAADGPAAGPRKYIIQSGDTLGVIAQRECGSVRMLNAIMELNPGVDPSALRIGATLLLPGKTTSATRDRPDAGTLPGIAGNESARDGGATRGPAKPGGTYTARAGDTFERISKRVYGTIERWPDIWVANLDAVPDSDRIPAGTLLKLPN